MIDYVKDKEFLKKSYSLCADLVNQLVQELKHYGIETKQEIVGSGRHGLITQNGKGPIDYDFNLWILDDGGFIEGSELKKNIMDAFDFILARKDLPDCFCKDSCSVITTKKMVLPKGNRTPFSIDLCIVKEDKQGRWYRLIHQKTGIVQLDRWIWNQGPDSREIYKKEAYLKPEHWQEVRDAYLQKKRTYLKQNIHTKPSFVCYIEAINDVYNKYQSCNTFGWVNRINLFYVQGGFYNG